MLNEERIIITAIFAAGIPLLLYKFLYKTFYIHPPVALTT